MKVLPWNLSEDEKFQKRNYANNRNKNMSDTDEKKEKVCEKLSL